jgi:uncharacterized protein (TIGR02453 family)
MDDFQGLPRGTPAFLAELAANNRKDWFEKHRAEYEECYLEAGKAFVEAMGARLQEIAPIVADPRVNGSIFRINRDVRFSEDKTPYKSHLSIVFWAGPSKKEMRSCFYFRLLPDEILLGCGNHQFDKPTLARFRTAVVDAKSGEALEAAVAEAEAGGLEVEGAGYKHVPRGFDADHPRARFLKHNGLMTGLTLPLNDTLHSPEIIELLAAEWQKAAPLHLWLTGI